MARNSPSMCQQLHTPPHNSCPAPLAHRRLPDQPPCCARSSSAAGVLGSLRACRERSAPRCSCSSERLRGARRCTARPSAPLSAPSRSTRAYPSDSPLCLSIHNAPRTAHRARYASHVCAHPPRLRTPPPSYRRASRPATPPTKSKPPCSGCCTARASVSTSASTTGRPSASGLLPNWTTR